MKLLVPGDAFRGRDLTASEFNHIPGWQSALLGQLGKLAVATNDGQRLLLVLRVIDSARFAALYVANNTGLVDQLAKPKSAGEIEGFDPAMLRSFLVLIVKLGLARKLGDDRVVFKPRFRTPLQPLIPELQEAVRANRWQELASHRDLIGPHAVLWRSFVFLSLLNCIRQGISVDLDQCEWCGMNRRWRDIAQSGRLDYEIVSSGLVFEMLPVTLVDKAPCGYSEQLFFAELGQKAFHAFVGAQFTQTLTKLAEGRRFRSAMDIGCGLGDYVESLRASGNFQSVIGVERHREAIARLRQRFADAEDVTILAEEVLSKMTLPKVDVVLLIFVLLYLSREQKLALFRQLADNLAEDGVIVIGQYFPDVEGMRKEIAMRQGDYGLLRKMDILFSSRLQYAEVLVNDCSSAFSQAERWDELNDVIEQAGLRVQSVTNADPYYYAFFVVVGRAKAHPGATAAAADEHQAA